MRSLCARRPFNAVVAGGLLVALPLATHAASTFGSLANFDVVNDTGLTARGFEIELEGIGRSDVLDVFGLNRDFGTGSPGDVERYGIPTVGDLLDGSGKAIGVRITYQAAFANGVWSTGTPSGAFTTPGESCWLFGNVGYPNVPCDHFGVSTLGTPTRTTYNWLVESSPGVVTPAPVAVPAVAFTPPAGAAQPVVAQIQAQQVDPVDPRNNAFWVKLVQTSVPENVELHELMGGRNPFDNDAIAALGEAPETEIEWYELQPGFVDELSKELNQGNDPSVVVRYEFYRYKGSFDDEGLIDPKPWEKPVGDVLNEYVGDYVGMQIAGYNAVQAVPEPTTWALMLGGLVAIGARLRRRRDAT